VGQRTARASVVALIDLGTLGGPVSQAKAVNRRGQVVGTSADAQGRTRAFLWQEDLGMVDLQPLTGVNTSANDISERGDIVGGGDTGFGDFHAYYLSEGTSFDLGTLGGNESEALALNLHGQVVGHSRVGGGEGPLKHAFFIPEPGTMLDLGTLGGPTSIAHAVNDRGEVVGLAATAAGEGHAFMWSTGAGMRDLGTLEAGGASVALGINNRTEVVGGSGRAFLWSAGTGMVDLGTLGGRTSCAYGVNDAGFVVGVSQMDAVGARGLPLTHAFLRTPDGCMVDLGTVGGDHSAAAALSQEEHGALWIAGHSHDRSGRLRAVVWSVRLG
jgi:probable HAF family extracellular repeat protein